MKKIFGGINLTWKKLIIFAVVMAIYTAVMAILPITKDTSFRDIASYFECWIVIGIIIIANSKSPVDSALKCFVFFLISQPLIYLIQVPFSDMGFGLFKYYRYWFIWTLCTIPMGFIGYYINKKNMLSVIILFPMLVLLSIFGISYISQAFETFPHHLLSGIFCLLSILLITIGIFDTKKYKIITIVLVVLASTVFVLYDAGYLGFNKKVYEAYDSLEEYNIVLSKDYYRGSFIALKEGSADIVEKDGKYQMRLTGVKGETYKFSIFDDNNAYIFEYSFDENGKLKLEKK